MYSPLRHRSTTECTGNINYVAKEYIKASNPSNVKSYKNTANSSNKKGMLRKNQSTILKPSSRSTAKKSLNKGSFDEKIVNKIEPNKTKIIYGLQQDAATLINKLNKKRQKYTSLKSSYATLKKENASKIQTLEGSISTLIEESLKHKDRSHSQEKQIKEKDIITQQNAKLTKDINYYKKELIHCKDNIAELTAQISQYKRQILKGDGHFKKDNYSSLQKILNRVNNIPACRSLLGIEPNSTESMLDSIYSVVDYLINSKEYSEQKYNKLLALHEMIVDAEGDGVNPNIYKVMDENEQLKKKLMSMQSTHKLKEASYRSNNGVDEFEFTAKVAQLEKELKSIEILNNKEK